MKTPVLNPSSDTITAAPDALISLRTAALRLELSTRALYRLISRGDLPVPVKVGGASRLYESDLRGYFDRLKAERCKRF